MELAAAKAAEARAARAAALVQPEPEPEPEPEPAAAAMAAPPGFIGNLTPTQAVALDALRALAAAEMGSAAGQKLASLLRGDDFVLVRFLRATGFVVPYAHRVLQKCLEWRASQGPLFFEDPERRRLFAQIEPMFTAGYHRYTCRGEPVELWRIGQIWPHEMLEQFSQQEIEQIWFHHLEHSLYAQRDVADRLGWAGGTAGLVLVMDLQGMGKRHLAPRVLKLVSALFGVGQKMYPENVNRILVVNAPALFELGFSAVKPALHENTIAKISVVSSANSEELAAMLGGPHRLPTFLGGTDHDCSIGYREPEASEWLVVAAGACHTHVVRVPAAAAAAVDGGSGHGGARPRPRHASIWFRSRSFGARFAVWRRRGGGGGGPATEKSGGESGERVSVLALQLYPSHAYPQQISLPLGEEACTLDLVFDNSDSWMTSLEILCEATIEATQEETAETEEGEAAVVMN